MRSSTSNSEADHAWWGVKAMLCGAVAVLLSLECGARWLVPMTNWNMRRFQQERAQAMSLGTEREMGKADVLLLGNSLTFTDIDLESLRRELGPRERVCRWAVDNTSYLDWYYGLRRAIRHGAKPQFVVIGGRGSHFLATSVRGWFFSHYMLDPRDLLEAGSAIKANATTLSGMGVAQLSAFYGSREEVYKRWLTLVLPSFPDLGERIALKGANDNMSEPASPGLMSQRLHDLRALCAECGARLILWVPPISVEEPYASLLRDVCAKEGIPVLLPEVGNAWSTQDFADGFHMTTEAAKRFTQSFALRLSPLLAPDSKVQAEVNSRLAVLAD